MLKKRIAIVVALVILLSVPTTFASAELPAPVKGQMIIDVIVDGQKVKFPDTEPFIDANNRTMVPVRFVSEKLGATVSWDAANQIVGIKYGTKEITMPIGSNIVKVDGSAVTLDTTATLTEGRTMVPLRFVSEVLSSTVTWDAAANAVQVSDAAYLAKVADGSVKLDPWGRQISDKTSNEWNLLIDVPQYAYDLPTKSNISSNYSNIRFSLKNFSWANKEYLDLWSSKIRKYYVAALNVDYRTIDKDLFVSDLEANMQFGSDFAKASTDTGMSDYVKFVKENHIITKGFADPETYLVRYERGTPVMRTHFKFMVISSDRKDQDVLDSFDHSVFSDSQKFSKGLWYDGYADVELYTNAGNQQENHYALDGSLEHMFRTGQYSYKN
jgi:hypothetical protein